MTDQTQSEPNDDTEGHMPRRYLKPDDGTLPTDEEQATDDTEGHGRLASKQTPGRPRSSRGYRPKW